VPREPIATFIRDGQAREAYTPGEAVTLRADGWREALPEPEPSAAKPVEPDTAAEPPAAEPAGTSLDLGSADIDPDLFGEGESE
jgi:hypothetical protein